jgi:hypothetical protein
LFPASEKKLHSNSEQQDEDYGNHKTSNRLRRQNQSQTRQGNKPLQNLRTTLFVNFQSLSQKDTIFMFFCRQEW